MKTLIDRTEIATAINYKQYPVVAIDVSKRDEYGIVGCPVCIDNGFFRTGEPYYINATCRVYNDEKALVFSRGCVGIAADFGYRDIEKMLEYANVPVIKPNSDVLVAIIDSANRVAYAPVIIRTDKRVNALSATPLRFTEPLSFARFFDKEDEA